MKSFKGFDELFNSILRKEGGILRSGQKFLGVFDRDSVLELERLLRIDLGSYVGRIRRPFIGMFKKESNTYLVAFLSAKDYSRRPVDLNLCNMSNQDLCGGLETRCYILKDRNRQQVLVYEIPCARFESFFFYFCGSCADMEWIENIRRFSVV